MKRNLRVSAGALAASAALLAAAMPAGAAGFRVDAIMKNDLHLKAVPSSALVLGGSSFDYNLVLAAEGQWHNDTHKSPLAPDLSTKSGLGRSNMISGAYAIGFSDFPLNQVPGSPDVGPGSPNPSLSVSNFAQVPIALGGVAITYHFGTGISGSTAALLKKYPLTLAGNTLGAIFAGKITNWDSKTIASENPHLVVKGKDQLPNLAIQVMSRTAGSGTTFIFKGYLNEVDKKGTSRRSTRRTSGPGSNQFANSTLLEQGVQSTNGAIGYVEYGYAIDNGIPTITLINRSGAHVALSEAGIVQAAAAGLNTITANKSCKGFKTTVLACYEINNEAGATVYPIAGFS